MKYTYCPKCKKQLIRLEPYRIGEYRFFCDACSTEVVIDSVDYKTTVGLNPRKNAEGYDDLTAYEGVKRADRSRDEERETIAKLMGCLHRVCEFAGYSIENRIVLKNNKTGKVWD